MVEASIALAGVAVAIATFLPTCELPEGKKQVLAILAGITAALSSYGALWLLALNRHPEVREWPLGIGKILSLFSSPRRNGPWWFIGWGLLAWFLLSVLVGGLAVSSVVH
jgi:hypothetical protein